MASVALVTSSMSPVDGTNDDGGSERPTSRSLHRQQQQLAAQLVTKACGSTASSYLVRPQAICAPAFIDPSKVARRARLV